LYSISLIVRLVGTIENCEGRPSNQATYFASRAEHFAVEVGAVAACPPHLIATKKVK
jgi:hypothetical protein